MKSSSGQAKRRRRTSTSRVTMADVASAAGVSAQTVSRVLNQPAAVGEEVSRRVHEAIRKLQYVPNFAASQMASNRSGIVAAIIPTISASVFAETVQALSNVLLPSGYQILVGNTEYDPEREEQLVRSFLGRGPDGLLLTGTRHTPGLVDLLSRSNIPVVETWDWEEKPLDLLVGFSNEGAARRMVEHLYEQGYRKIVFAGVTNAGDFRAKRRLNGYCEAAKQLRLGEPRVMTMTGQPLTTKVGAATLDKAIAEYPDADAIFFSSDVFAAGALLACSRRGIAVPQQIAIAGFGDFEIAENLVPSLTTVSVHPITIGRRAAELLLARIRNERITDRYINVGYQLVVRESA